VQCCLRASCDSCAENVENKELCKLTLSNDDLVHLRDAIEDLYYFEFVIGWCYFVHFLCIIHYVDLPLLSFFILY